MNAILPGQARSRRDDRMPAPRPARGRKSPSIQAFRSKAARRGPAAGDKVLRAPPGRARAGGHSPREPRPRSSAGRGWSCSRRSGPRAGVTTSRSICPETSAGGRPGRSSRPTIETSARLPGANTGAKRGSAIRASTLPPAPRARPRSSRRHCGRDSDSAASRRRSARDIGQRLQQPVHQRAALQRAGAQLDRFAGPDAMAVVVGGIGRAQQAVGGRFRRRRRQQPCRQRDRRRRCAASAAAPWRRGILRPRDSASPRRSAVSISSSCKSGIVEALADQIVPGELAHVRSCCRACSRRRSGDRPRASSPHRAGGDIRPRSRPASPCARRRRPADRRPCGRPRPRPRACGRIALRQVDQPQPLRIRRRGRGVDQEHDGASSPLAPCTVMTRTSSREISMSRFTSVSAARSQAMKPCSEAGALRS